MIRLATVFSGIGAIESALEYLNEDYKIVFACDNGERELKKSYDEIDDLVEGKSEEEVQNIVNRLYRETKKENYVKQSYFANYKINDNQWFEDIKYLNGNLFENEIDLFVGGSPCQSFSVNGKRAGLKDIRGTLFYEYCRIINESKPKVFIYENVRGMLNHDKGNTWKVVKMIFNLLDYDIYIRQNDGKEDPILNSKDYGIPQNRERLYVVGFRKNLNIRGFEFPIAEELSTRVNNYLESKVNAQYYLKQKGFEFVTSNPSRARVGNDIIGCQKANQQFNWNGDFIFEPLESIIDRHDVLERAYVGNWKGQVGVCRKFTPRECLRLMGFKDSFKIIHKDEIMYRQAGNSIVVNVLMRLVESIKKTGVWDND
ncbi:MAG: DNA cytosine methyltransferase [Christensenella sp.]|nr:DNA cytosine methyltransferase [Christensenella sp.]